MPAGTGHVFVAFPPALRSGAASSASIGAKCQREAGAGAGAAAPGHHAAVGARSQAAHLRHPAPLCLDNFVRLDNPNTRLLSDPGAMAVPGMRAPNAGERFHPRAACPASSSLRLLQVSTRACGSSSSAGEPSPAQLSIRPGVPTRVLCPRSHARRRCWVLSPHGAACCRAGGTLA